MKQLSTILLLLSSLLLVSACDDNSGSTSEQGTEGNACYPNGTCNEGLDCIEDVCTAQNTNNINNTNNTNGVNNANPGELNGPCLEGDHCNSGLVCFEEVCLADADGDGYHAGVDCDDSNGDIKPDYVRVCTSICDEGTQMCLADGTWTTCTAEEDCSCDEPGGIREHDCGNCGWGYQHCGSDYQWGMVDECFDEGECRPGSYDTRACSFCGTQTRMCDPQCGWLEWSECENPGECMPGDLSSTTNDCTPLGAIRQIECADTCSWEDTGDCIFECQGDPRSGTIDASGFYDYKDELCIPAGQFIMGSDIGYGMSIFPSHVVTLSAYFIDKYEVAIRRYRECIDDGYCIVSGDQDFYDDGMQAHPARVTHEAALTFCAWDGGRTLPSEAQWVKAARGPYPSTNLHPWGDDPATCLDYTDNINCTVATEHEVDYWGERDVSYYGAVQMGYGVQERVLDSWEEDYFSTADDLNPLNINDGTELATVRGKAFYNAQNPSHSIIRRQYSTNGYSTHGFRCARGPF